MSKAKGLGRGFDSLIPTKIEREFDPVPAGSQAVIEIKVGLIDPNPYQPRNNFNQQELEALAASITEHGVLQPLVAQRRNGRYQLIAGERRLRAAKIAGLASVPVIVRSFDEQQSLELALVENIQREQLNPVETAAAYQKLLGQFNLSIDEIAKRVGRNQSTVKNTLRLLKLPTQAKRALVDGQITEGHARAVLSVSDINMQLELLGNIINKSWTVRRAEEYARDAKTGAKAPGQITSETPATKNLSKRLNTKVQLQRRAQGGRVLIHYQDEDELSGIMERLSNA